ncbi:MAG: 4Fe-4S cluster-binding domain-containing protein, partial [Planctomycetaceae bacterium]|nr:4Fe-4S cluster-binding domain-containing protein [Planctomycetaceae bacterium]
MNTSRKIRLYCLELHLTSNCNLACKGCSQSSPISPTKVLSIDTLSYTLGLLKPHILPEKIQIIGGEPLTLPNILDALTVIKNSEIANKLCIKTNGILLHKMPPDFWQTIDQVIVSSYPATAVRLSKTRKDIFEIAVRAGCLVEYRHFSHFNYIGK